MITRFINIFLLVTIVTTINFPRFFFIGKDNAINYVIIDKEVTKNCFTFILRIMENNYEQIQTNMAGYLKLDIYLISKNIVQIKMKDMNTTNYEMPYEDPFPFHKNIDNIIEDFNMNNLKYDYEFLIKEYPFSISILRKETKEVIFSTLNRNIIFQENYIEISTELASDNMFGLGERTTNFKLKSGLYTLYNKDSYGEIEDGKGKGKNRYGSHPMYLMREKSRYYHISYLRNSFPMDILIDHENNMLTYKIVGGILDLNFFIGNDNPNNAIEMYHQFLGGYRLPPFWSMGFHQCRWGYKNLSMLKEVLSKYEENSLPLDTIWMDIDYMKDYMSFTVDTDRFNIDEFNSVLNSYNKKFVMIAEPSIGIKWGDNFEFYKLGKDLDIFIKNKEGEYLINKVWPGKCHFIDYFNPNAKDFWFHGLETLHDKLKFSGVWLDMNEIAAFSPGQIDIYENILSCNDEKNYKYIPGSKPFETATLCPNSKLYNNTTFIELHNYYPNQQAKLTYEYLENKIPNQFPFILTRANSAGIGKYSAHWSGDNLGTFDFYKYSISEVFNSNLFGIPMSGTDICGFGYDTPELLCAKWYQMGSLFPFSRSHSHMDYYRKEPYAMGSLLLETTRKSLKFRYSILRYYYSLFMINKGKGAIFKPLFLEFFDDSSTLKESVIDNFFMIGNSLLVIPNFNENESEDTYGYFPKGNWYDLRTNLQIKKEDNINGDYYLIKVNLREMPAVFLRSGKTIFKNYSEDIKNSYELINEYFFLIALDKDDIYNNNNSEGFIPALSDYNSRLYVEECMELNCFYRILTNYNIGLKIMTIDLIKPNHFDSNFEYIGLKKIYIYGIDLENNKFNEVKIENYNTQSLVEKINENCLMIQFNEVVKIKKEDMKIYVKFS